MWMLFLQCMCTQTTQKPICTIYLLLKEYFKYMTELGSRLEDMLELWKWHKQSTSWDCSGGYRVEVFPSQSFIFDLWLAQTSDQCFVTLGGAVAWMLLCMWLIFAFVRVLAVVAVPSLIVTSILLSFCWLTPKTEKTKHKTAAPGNYQVLDICLSFLEDKNILPCWWWSIGSHFASGMGKSQADQF